MYRYFFTALFSCSLILQGILYSDKVWQEYLVVPEQKELTLNGYGFLQGATLSEEQNRELKWALDRKEEIIRIASFNVLFNILDTALPKEYQWKSRASRVVETIKRINPDIIGLQETQVDQLEDIKELLGEEYAYLSAVEAIRLVDPKNNFTDGILYRIDRFTLVHESFTYASPTPKLPSISENAGFPTVNHHVILRDKITDRVFAVTNTHLYFLLPDVRSQAIDAFAVFMQEHKEIPMFFIGDFNMFSPLLDHKPKFLDGHYMLRKLRKLGLVDSFEESRIGHIGPLSSYTDSIDAPHKPFTGSGIPGVILDRIFITDCIVPLLHGIYGEKIDNYFASDHFPVFIDCLITGN